MLETGLVDYSVGAMPMTGAWVIVHEESPLKRAQLTYYKLGDGPFFVFYTPFHLPHVQIPSTIGRAVIHQDPTVAPLAGPVCEVLTIAKRDLKAGERLDGVGGFCSYGLIDNRAAARAIGRVAHRLVRRLRAAAGCCEGRGHFLRRCGVAPWSVGGEALAGAERALAIEDGFRTPTVRASASRVGAERLGAHLTLTRQR